MPPISRKQLGWLAKAFIASQAFWAVLTLVNLGLDYDAQMLRVQQNGNIDVPGSISHIYFGLLMAFAVILGIYIWLHHRQGEAAWKIGALILAVLICFVTLHILNSRTAQLSLYAGLAIIASEVFHRKAYVTGLVALLILLSTPVVAYYLVPSFKMRVRVTVWDFQQSEQGGGDLVNNSLSTRRVGWKAAWGSRQRNPVWGVGLEDLRAEMVKSITNGDCHSDPVPNSLQVPHNLYLKYWAGTGIPGLLLLLGMLAFPMLYQHRPFPSLLYGFLAMMAVGLCFENFLERQIGIIFFILAYLYLLPPEEAHHSVSSASTMRKAAPDGAARIEKNRDFYDSGY